MIDTVVVDASVGVKWFFEEELSEKALDCLGMFDKNKLNIVVPEIFYSEIASACWKRARKKSITIERAIRAQDRLMSFSFEKYSDRELSDVALTNALQFGISVYDGLYLALAEVYFSPLITADKALFNKCKGKFDFIEYLGDFEVSH